MKQKYFFGYSTSPTCNFLDGGSGFTFLLYNTGEVEAYRLKNYTNTFGCYITEREYIIDKGYTISNEVLNKIRDILKFDIIEQLPVGGIQ